ncbi:hypothetical protein V2N46_10690 [Streptococcus pneumoniae]
MKTTLIYNLGETMQIQGMVSTGKTFQNNMPPKNKKLSHKDLYNTETNSAANLNKIIKLMESENNG